MFFLSWQDIVMVLAHCYIPDKEAQILENAKEFL